MDLNILSDYLKHPHFEIQPLSGEVVNSVSLAVVIGNKRLLSNGPVVLFFQRVFRLINLLSPNRHVKTLELFTIFKMRYLISPLKVHFLWKFLLICNYNTEYCFRFCPFTYC